LETKSNTEKENSGLPPEERNVPIVLLLGTTRARCGAHHDRSSTLFWISLPIATACPTTFSSASRPSPPLRPRRPELQPWSPSSRAARVGTPCPTGVPPPRPRAPAPRVFIPWTGGAANNGRDLSSLPHVANYLLFSLVR
jgi:hypothetical protein